MKEYTFTINGKVYNVSVGEAEGKILPVKVNGADYEVELENAPAAAPVSAPAKTAAPSPAQEAAKPAAAAPAGGKVIQSPLPGIIVSIDVKEGQAVKRGQKVAVIEAMKMENDILAEVDGTITAIHVGKGDSVLEGADIVTIG